MTPAQHDDLIGNLDAVATSSSRIRSLSMAAGCVLRGDAIADKVEACNVASDLLSLIEFLAETTGFDVETLEKIYVIENGDMK